MAKSTGLSPCWEAGRGISGSRLHYAADSDHCYCRTRCGTLFAQPSRSIVCECLLSLGSTPVAARPPAPWATTKSCLVARTGPACKLSKVSEKEASQILRSLISECCKNAGIKRSDIEHTCIGLAGISGPKVTESMRALLAEIVGGDTKVVGDMTIALEAAFGGAPGVIVISRHRLIAYGRNQRGDTARAGGWGPTSPMKVPANGSDDKQSPRPCVPMTKAPARN